jgi:hypothetical protein
MSNERALSATRVRELLDYDPETGHFYWRVSRGRVSRGSLAGGVHIDGYVLITLDGRIYRSHRLAWLYTHGAWPNGEIDHINGDRTDNRVINLRDTTRAENSQNQRHSRKGSKAGLIGVSWQKITRRWQARIFVSGKNKHLGYFDTPEAAHAAYINAKTELHPFSTINQETM